MYGIVNLPYVRKIFLFTLFTIQEIRIFLASDDVVC